MVALFALAAFQAASAIQQADLMRGNAAITKEIADDNAKYAEIDANQAIMDGQKDVARYETQITQATGDQKVAFAANNIDAGYGTAKDVITDSKVNGLLNKIDIANQAQSRAMGYRQEARSLRINGAMGQTQANINAFGTEASGLAQAAGTGFRAYSETQPLAGRGNTPVLGSSNYSRK